MWKCGNALPYLIQSIQNSQNLQDYIFYILQCFAAKLDNCMKFRMLFPAVLIDFSNSKVCLIGKCLFRIKLLTGLYNKRGGWSSENRVCVGERRLVGELSLPLNCLVRDLLLYKYLQRN